jgi:hypothetical protein
MASTPGDSSTQETQPGTEQDDAFGSDDAFGVDDASDDFGMGGGDTAGGTDPGAAAQPEQNINGEASPDEKRKKVKYFQELEKKLGVIEEFIDSVVQKVSNTSTTDTFALKNYTYIKDTLIDYKNKLMEVLTQGIIKLSYTDLVRLFLYFQTVLEDIRKLYEFTNKQVNSQTPEKKND